MDTKTVTFDAIPLNKAVLCESCQFVTVARNHHCPVCGASGEGLVRINRFFEREARERKKWQS
jgi:hypothetical protein